MAYLPPPPTPWSRRSGSHPVFSGKGGPICLCIFKIPQKFKIIRMDRPNRPVHSATVYISKCKIIPTNKFNMKIGITGRHIWISGDATKFLHCAEILPVSYIEGDWSIVSSLAWDWSIISSLAGDWSIVPPIEWDWSILSSLGGDKHCAISRRRLDHCVTYRKTWALCHL